MQLPPCMHLAQGTLVGHTASDRSQIWTYSDSAHLPAVGNTLVERPMAVRPCTYSHTPEEVEVEVQPWHPDEGEAVEAVADMGLPKDSHHLCTGRAVAYVEGEAGEVACEFVKVRYHSRPATTEEAQPLADAWLEVGKPDKGTRAECGEREGH